MIRTVLIVALMTALKALCGGAWAKDEPRIVIGLHDGPLATASLKDAEAALNHIGLLLEPHSTNDALPNLSGRSDVRGVLIWLDGGIVADPAGFTPWLRSIAALDLPIVLMGATPLAEDRFGMFLSLGIIYARDDRTYTYDLRAVEKDPLLVEYERRYDNLFPSVDLVRPLDAAQARSLMVLQRRGDVTDRTTPLLVTRKGGYIAPGFALWRSPDNGTVRWYVDPAGFFRTAFRLGVTPALDATTLSARRILAPAFIAARGKDDAPAADIAAQNFSAAYPDIPAALAAEGAPGQPVPRGGKPCANTLRVRLLGFGGAIAAIGDAEKPRRTARYAPLFSVCAEESGFVPLAASAVMTDAAVQPLISVIPPAVTAIDAGFHSAVLEMVSPQAWRVRNRDGLQTLRFDEVGSLRIDWNASEGVIGVGRVNGSLYVSLDPAVDLPLVSLTDTPWAPPPFPVLVESNWILSAMNRDWSQLTTDIQGLGRGNLVWSAPPNSQWEVRLTAPDGALQRYAAHADERGMMAFSLPPLAAGAATLEMLREDVSGPGP